MKIKVYVDEIPKTCDKCKWKKIIDCCAVSELQKDKIACPLHPITELEKLKRGQTK